MYYLEVNWVNSTFVLSFVLISFSIEVHIIHARNEEKDFVYSRREGRDEVHVIIIEEWSKLVILDISMLVGTYSMLG